MSPNAHSLNPVLDKSLKTRLFTRGLSFTSWGKVYVFITLGVGFAAVNTGNNLLFLVLGMMLGLIIVSGILAESTLGKIKVKRSLPPCAEEGVVFPVELALFNNKKYAPSFSVELRDDIDSKPFKRRCYFLRVDAKEKRSIAYRCEIYKRGYATFNGTVVSTKFPFGLFEKYRFIQSEEKTLILPSSINLQDKYFASENSRSENFAGKPGGGQEFRELRQMVNGDDPRRIHWKSTARVGRMMVRETAHELEKSVEIVLDAAAADDSRFSVAMAEQNIRAAATIIRQLAPQGFIIHLITAKNTGVVALAGKETIKLLGHLALLDVHKLAKMPPPRANNEGAVIIGPRAQKTAGCIELQVPAPHYVKKTV